MAHFGRLDRFTGRVLIPAAAALMLLGAPVVPAQAPPAEPSAEDWRTALSALRQIAMDPKQLVERRANAAMAYAKLQSLRGEHDDAIGMCWQVLSAARNSGELSEAPARAACYSSRQAHGHLGGPAKLMDAWEAKPPHAQARAALRRVRLDLVKMTQYLMGLAGRKMPPKPVRTVLAGWAELKPGPGVRAVGFAAPKVATPKWTMIQAGRGPSVLRVSLRKITPSPLLAPDNSGVPRALKLDLPVYAAPSWYKRVSFPPLKQK